MFCGLCWQPVAARAASVLDHARITARAFAVDYGSVEWPKAAARITDDLNVLLEFSNHPAEHWVHLRTASLEMSLCGVTPTVTRRYWVHGGGT